MPIIYFRNAVVKRMPNRMLCYFLFRKCEALSYAPPSIFRLEEKCFKTMKNVKIFACGARKRLFFFRTQFETYAPFYLFISRTPSKFVCPFETPISYLFFSHEARRIRMPPPPGGVFSMGNYSFLHNYCNF